MEKSKVLIEIENLKYEFTVYRDGVGIIEKGLIDDQRLHKICDLINKNSYQFQDVVIVTNFVYFRIMDEEYFIKKVR